MNIALTQHNAQSNPQRDMIRTGYTPYVLGMGHFPVLLPNNVPDLGAYCDALDIGAVVLTGGGDIDPARYGQPNTHSESVSALRDSTEWALLDLALARGLPVLGICRGMQVINVYFGGGLVQDIPSTLGSPVPHNDEAHTHAVTITDPRMVDALGGDALTVNTHHHQGVTRDVLGPGFDVWAVSPQDGLVEGMLHREHPVLAVQWHPERPTYPASARARDSAVFQRFFTAGAFWLGR